MNKNFEIAYKAEVQQNIPNLWNRIESGLSEKSFIQTRTEVQMVQPEGQAQVKKLKKKNPYGWIKWASLAAACLIVLLIAPAVIGIGLVGMVKNEETAAADMAAPEAYYENAVMDMEFAEEEETVYMNEAEEVGKEFAPQETPATDGMLQYVDGAVPETEYYELVIGGLYAEVTAIESGNGYDEVILEFSERSRLRADVLLEESIYYDEGTLLVRVYPDKGTEPVLGENYRVDLYDTTLPGLSLIQPYGAELYKSGGEQY